MRATFYDITSLGLVGLSIFFFYRSIAFLTEADYVSAVIMIFVGFLVIRVGAEFARFALISSKRKETMG